MMKSPVLGCLALALGCAGCARTQAPSEIAPANAITLQKAMEDTMDALYGARARAISYGGPLFGLYACTVTAVFNISASATAENKLSLGVSGGPPPAVAPVSINLQGGTTATTNGSRGNQVTLTLATPECRDVLGGGKGSDSTNKAKPGKGDKQSNNTLPVEKPVGFQ